MFVLDFTKHLFFKHINLTMKKQGKISYIEVLANGMNCQQMREIWILKLLRAY